MEWTRAGIEAIAEAEPRHVVYTSEVHTLIRIAGTQNGKRLHRGAS